MYCKNGTEYVNSFWILKQVVYILTTLLYSLNNLSILQSFNTTEYQKRHRNPITGLNRPLGFQQVEADRFIDNRHMKVVRL